MVTKCIVYLLDNQVARKFIRIYASCLKIKEVLDVLNFVLYTEGDVTSQGLWSQYDRHFVGITRYNALS